jgi:molybdopterin/thiamine biosynthesis adenylyltransferase/rhodanese-related sulfurtransferase
MLSAAERERYGRHLALSEIGASGQEKLKAARVVIVGAGGLGSPAALYLAAAGIGTLGIVDHDRVDLSNLQRQLLFDTSNVGASKALSAQARLRALNPEIEVIAHDLELRGNNALEVLRAYDCVLDGSDRLSTRYLVNDACVLLQRPLVSAAIHRFEGQAMSYLPGRGPCYRCLFPAASEVAAPNCAEAGVLGVLPGVLGALQATEAIKLILGLGTPLVGRLLTYDALGMEWHEFRFSRREDCAVCGTHPRIRTAAELEAEHSAPARAPCRGLQPEQLRTLLDEGSGHMHITVVDVREPSEFAFGHLAGALNIPVADVQRRGAEIPLEFPVVFVCRSGARSRAACELAAGAGIQDPATLEGGMLAWAALIDPEMRVAPVA